jgi:serine protease Do
VRQFLLVAVGIIFGLLIYGAIDSLANNEQKINSADKTVDDSLTPVHYQAVETLDESRSTAITQAVSVVSPAVVSISVIKIQERVQRSPFSGDPFFERFFPEIYRDRVYRERVQSLGSGFVISEDGYIVTNDHVAGHGTQITINTPTGDEYPATLVGRDFDSDIALLKVDDHVFRHVNLGNSDDLLIGEWVIALGNPFGLFKRNKPTVTVGVVSATDRDFGRVEEGRIYQDMIQTDAAINTGNSGGPLVNAKGEVIGMNTFIFTGDRYTSGSVGIGFAIPANRIKEIVGGIKENKIDRDYWVGLSYLKLNSYVARQLGYPKDEGIYVSKIIRRSPAEKAGVELGDVILEINNVPVKDENTIDMAMGVYLKVGDTLPIKVWRNGTVKNINIKLEKRER